MSPTQPTAPLALVIDDDEMTRVLVRETLEAVGMRVEEASSGIEGIEACRRERPDIVLLDVAMPGMDGFECCLRLRGDPGGGRVPIVILTGMDDDASIERAYEVGATDFMSKPMPWKIFAHRVRYLLRASRSLEQLARSEASLLHAQGVARVGNWVWKGGEPETWSIEMYRILGLDPARDTAGFGTFLKRVARKNRDQVKADFVAPLKRGGMASFEVGVVRPDGEERTVFLQLEVQQDGCGRTTLVRGTMQDVTERKQTERKVHALAYFDSLTGLPNRLQFKQQLTRALRGTARGKGRIAVMFIDLDHFKQINDSLGHSVGDELLKAVAARLSDCLRGSDDLCRENPEVRSIARLGGDEFTVMLTGLAHAEDAAKVAQRIIDSVARPISIEGRELFVTASVGIAVHPHDGGDVDTLLKNADVAMYVAKDVGRNNFKFYSSEMNSRALERLDLERDLHRALERGELMLHYQPQVDGASGRVTGVEALLRWNHPTRGLVSPAHFIPIAEQSGLITPIGHWVLAEACRQAQAWCAQGVGPLQVWVNVSGVQFRDRRIADSVRSALELSGLAAELLVLEATETIMVEGHDAALATLHELKALGVGIALDDFGTGYSSLAYLKRFPIDTLKIDGSFVADLDNDGDEGAIVAAIIAMSRSLKLKVIAEGVETRRQSARLLAMGCPHMQGYLHSRPVPAAQIASIVRERLLPCTVPLLRISA